MKNCVFCSKGQSKILCENELAKAFYDQYPVNQGHVLVVPKRHVETYFDATMTELTAMQELIFQVKDMLVLMKRCEQKNSDGYLYLKSMM